MLCPRPPDRPFRAQRTRRRRYPTGTCTGSGRSPRPSLRGGTARPAVPGRPDLQRPPSASMARGRPLMPIPTQGDDQADGSPTCMKSSNPQVAAPVG